MADLVHRGQEFGRKNHASTEEVVKRSLDLTGEDLNTPQALEISHLWVEVYLHMKEGVNHKRVILMATRWMLLCLTVSMDHLCMDYQVACSYQICQGHPRCSCLSLVLGKWSHQTNSPSNAY
jgi:hypothetical protein